MEKTCSKCGNSYPATTKYFCIRNKGKGQLDSWCRKCKNEASKKWRENNKEKAKEAVKTWQAKNKDNIKKNRDKINRNIRKYERKVKALKNLRKIQPEKTMIGMKIGKLLVYERVYRENTKHTYYKCFCDCGNECIVAGDSLKSGDTKSCGCLKSELQSQKIIGQRFGRLLVLSKAKTKPGDNSVYLCKCDCGNTCEVSSKHLGRGTNSCGCLYKEAAQKDVVENTRLRLLTRKKRKRINPDSGVKGVSWDRGKWRAHIGFQGKKINLGRFADLQEAIEVRKKAEEKYFKPILKKYNIKA